MSGSIRPHDYLLGELTDEERMEAERLLREDPEFAAAVEELRPVVDALERVPEAEWRGIPPLEQASPARDAPPRPVPTRLRWLRPGLAALAASGVALIALLVVRGSEEDDPAFRAALEPIPQRESDATGEVTLAAGADDVTLEVAGLERNKPGESYELWFLNDTDDLVSLGSFRVEGEATTRIELPVPADPADYRFLDVSVEPDDGDPSHSGDSVLRGPLT
jgi:anti-sigma-K factor RskA